RMVPREVARRGAGTGPRAAPDLGAPTAARAARVGGAGARPGRTDDEAPGPLVDVGAAGRRPAARPLASRGGRRRLPARRPARLVARDRAPGGLDAALPHGRRPALRRGAAGGPAVVAGRGAARGPRARLVRRRPAGHVPLRLRPGLQDDPDRPRGRGRAARGLRRRPGGGALTP